MAEKSKLKILYILNMMRKTDENHPINSTQIAEELLRYGISAERKSIGRDIDCLMDAGYQIEKCENHNLGWYMKEQDFEEYELKMLADAVASAKFLTEKQSRTLITKIKNLATKEGERLIEKTLLMDSELKVVDEKFKFKFDTVMRAIAAHKQIRFQYQEWGTGNKKVLKRDGYMYQVSPYYIVLSNEEYFLIGNPGTHDGATHFRIEMMTVPDILEEPARSMGEIEKLKEIENGRSIGDYLRENINMWNGDVARVTLRARNSCRHDLMMKFGRNIMMRDDGDDCFVAHVKVADGDGFYRWLAAYGTNVTLVKPESMQKKYIAYLQSVMENYGQL